ncbi:unnamed protein product [Leptidea sinapis]|uniref:UDP-glycosyltransferases domain-containing protein n=1 Tax=Leptidea sinapis TaxID=189913 RepID=A0A5E4QW05_9NEOP|nr:unnamed protein product [Leptidea sinapis]
MNLPFIVLWSIYLLNCEGANILYSIPFISKSHNIFLRPLGLELARRGHNVTVLTSHKEDSVPHNYNEVLFEKKDFWEITGKPRPNIFTTNAMSEITFIEEVLWKGGLAFTEHLLNSTTMKKFLENDYNFDLVICEDFIQEAFYMLSHKYQAPLIVVTPYGNSMKQLFMVGNPLQLSTVLYEFVAIEDPTSFAGRLKNLYVSAYEFIFWRYRYLDKQEQLVKKYIKNLPQPVPSLYDIQKNASLFLINSHFSFDVPVAYQPNIIEVGGLHVAHSDDVLPQDLKSILSESKHGVIYVNFGSNVKSSELPGDKKRALLNTFNKLQHTVLWKWEEDYMEDKPNNVIIRKWFPQSAVLAHPNVKLFITHGGLMSTQEAIYHGVPLVGVPIFADQFNNILLAEQAGFGRVLQYEQLNDKNVDSMLIAKLLCVTLILITKCCECANILYVIPFTSKSHYILLSPIGLELARRGHNVTVITANREHNPPSNYHQIMVDDVKIWEVIGEERPNIFTMVNLPAEIFHQKILWGGGAAFTEVALNSSDVQHLLKSDSKFDLVICEQFFQEAFYVLAQKYNAPLALVTTFGNCMRHNIITRNPLQLATVVSEFLDVEDPTSFWSRLRNVYFAVYEFVWWKYWYLEKQETLVKKYIPDVKDFSLYDIQKNFSVMLINSHFSYDVPAAYLPNIIEIGGIHLTQSYGSPPKDLQKLLDGSEAGIIYVNFGSNVRSAEMPLEKRDAFLNVFRTLKQMVLWKWENESIVNKPDNLITQSWFPQREILGKQEELMRKYIPALPQPIPNLVDIQKNASLMLVNRHFSVDSSIAYLPNVVEIGGVHITKTNTTLPKDLQTILDEAKHGVVYVNFGSNVRSSELPDEKKQAFLNVFRRLRQTVIWKWEDDELKGKSDNIITRQWFPQKDILNHPNIKVFISHGGLIGTQEAIYGGVPIIGIPIYGDQLNNLFSIEELGIGRILRYHDINEENLFELLSEFVNTDAYKKKAEEVSRRYLDRPMSALDTAVFWLEYVIRNNGAPYMKSPAIELNWWAYTMLDVYIFLAVTLTLTMFVIIKILIFVKMILMTQKSNIKSKKS